MNNNTKKEKVQSIIIAILGVIIVFGGAFFASELKYCDVKGEEVVLDEIGMNEFTTLLNDENASIIYLARPGCYYCQQQEPIVENLVSSYDLPLFYLNTDELTDDQMNSLFAVDKELFGEDGDDFGTPTTLVVKGGKIVDSLVGLTQQADFEQFLKNNGFIK